MVFGLLLVKNEVSKSLWIIIGSLWILLIKRLIGAATQHPQKDFLEKQFNLAMNYSVPSNLEHEQSKKILVILLKFVVCLLLQMKAVEKHHGKSKTGASANETHLAWCRGCEFKSGCEQRVNPIWIHDSSIIISEKVGKNINKITSDYFSWHARLHLLCS